MFAGCVLVYDTGDAVLTVHTVLALNAVLRHVIPGRYADINPGSVLAVFPIQTVGARRACNPNLAGFAVFPVLAGFADNEAVRFQVFIQHHNDVAIVVNPRPYALRAVLAVLLGSLAAHSNGIVQFRLIASAVTFKGQSAIFNNASDLAIVHCVRIIRTGRYIRNFIAACVDAAVTDDYVAVGSRHCQRVRGHTVQTGQVFGQLYI